MWHRPVFHELERIHFALITLRTEMMDAHTPNCLESLPQVVSSKEGFIHSIALKSVSQFVAGASPGVFAGPYLDVILCFRDKMIVRLLDQWKQVSDTSNRWGKVSVKFTALQNIDGQYANASAAYRTGARCMMTYLSQHTHMLPSNLEIPEKSLQLTGNQGSQGMMRKPGEHNQGGYANIIQARMFDTRTNTMVFVAIKSIKGYFTEETQQARDYCDALNGDLRMLIPFCRNCTERSSPAGPSVIHGSCLSLGSHTRRTLAICRS